MKIPSLLRCLLGVVVWTSDEVQAVFILPEQRTTGLGCIPDGATVNYECTVMDGAGVASTVWLGSAFNCSRSPSNSISFIHNLYGSAESGICGDLSAMSIGVDGTNYTSRLTVTANTGLDGTMISCTISTVRVEGSDTVRVGVIPSAPGPVVITFSNSGPPSFTVSWSPPSSPVVGGIGGYMFGVTGDCGDCMDMTVGADTLSVTCSGWTANDQTCTFEVRTLTQDCGFTSDAATSSVTLSASSPPSSPSVTVNSDTSCSLQSSTITVAWNAPARDSNIPPVLNYHVSVTREGTNMISNYNTSGTETSLVIPGSDFPEVGTYSFSVRANNGVEESDPVTTSAPVLATTVTSSSDEAMNSATLTYTLNPICTPGSIDVHYQECANQINCVCPAGVNYSNSVTETLPLSGPVMLTSTGLRPGVTYCYRSVVTNGGGMVAGIEDSSMFTTLPLAPPASLLNGAAVLVSSDPVVVYECVSSSEGFNGNSKQIEATLDATTGAFSVPPCSFLNYLIAVVAIVIIVVIIIVIAALGNVSGYYCYKHRRGASNSSSQTPTEMGPVYEDPDEVKPDPTTEGNVAYGHVQQQLNRGGRNGKATGQSSSQPPTELKQVGPIYEEPEDFKPDPNTEGNVAYGHVQPLHRRQ